VVASRRVVRVLCIGTRLSPTARPLTNVTSAADDMASAERSNGQPTVGIIVIGDEILKGQTQDTNSHFLVRRLFTLGARVRKISVIPDDLDVIAKEVFNPDFITNLLCELKLCYERKLPKCWHLEYLDSKIIILCPH